MIKLLPQTPAEKQSFAKRSVIEGLIALAGMGVLAAPSITPALQALTAPFNEKATDRPAYHLGHRTTGLEIAETPESGSVKFFAGRKEEYEFDLRLGLIFDHAVERMYDLRHTQPPADLMTAYTSLKLQFCARHAHNEAIEDERRAQLCPTPATPGEGPE